MNPADLSSNVDAVVKKAVDEFNEGDFYDAHDTLEECWIGSWGQEKRFLQGLIHLSVGFFKITNQQNYRGAVSQLTKALGRLGEFRPHYRRVNLDGFWSKVSVAIEQSQQVIDGDRNDVDLDLIPTIDMEIE